jgi:uncharacterized protein (TIGR02246 family)
MKNMNLFFLVFAVMVMVACGDKTNTAKLSELQKELLDNWDKTINAGDADALAMLYAEDAIRMQPNEPVQKGREAIRASFKSYIEKNETADDNILLGVTVSEDYVIAWGTYTSDYKPKSGGNQIHDVGKWVAISKQQPDGTLKIVMDIWNSDLPPVIPNQ